MGRHPGRIGYAALDDRFRDVEDPKAAQRIFGLFGLATCGGPGLLERGAPEPVHDRAERVH